MKRKCLECNYYNNGVCDMGENGTEYDEPYCELGHAICNLGEKEDKFCCYLSDKTFKLKEQKYSIAEEAESRYWHKQGLTDDHIYKTLVSMIEKIQSNSTDIVPYKIQEFLYDNDISLKVVGDTALRIEKDTGAEEILKELK